MDKELYTIVTLFTKLKFVNGWDVFKFRKIEPKQNVDWNLTLGDRIKMKF